MKKHSRFLALLLAALMLIAPAAPALAEAVQISDLTGEDYYALRAAAEGDLMDEQFWNPIILGLLRNAESLEHVVTILENANANSGYQSAHKTVDKNFYPVISDDERAEVNTKIANLYVGDVESSTTLRDAYAAQAEVGEVAHLLGGEANKAAVQSNIESQITEEQKTQLDEKYNALVETFVREELAKATSQEDFASLIRFMTDAQKLDFLNRLSDEMYALIQDFVDNYLWPDHEFTFAEERSFTNGLYVNGELITGAELLNYLFSLAEREFKVAVNQMNIDQAGSLEARASDAQADQILAAWRHAGFKVDAPSINSSAARMAAKRVQSAAAAANAADPVWPAEGSILLGKDAQAVEGQENLWEVTLDIQGKNYTTTSDVVLVIDCSYSMNQGAKMTNTRIAAKAFGEKLLTAGSTTRIAIVTFSNAASAYENGRFYTAGDLDAFDTAVDNATKISRGTNQQAGIHVAQQLLASAGSTGKLKNIVILSDGEATYSYAFVASADYTGCTQQSEWACTTWGPQGGSTANVGSFTMDYTTVLGTGSSFRLSNGNARIRSTCTIHGGVKSENGNYSPDDGTFLPGGNSNNGVNTIWEANQAKAAGTTIYSIALQAGTDGENTLKACASDGTDGKGYFKVSSSATIEADLKAAFDAVAGSLAIAARNGVVKDTMGEKVQLSFTGSAPRITADEAEYNAGNADVYISQGSATYDPETRAIDWNVGNVSESTTNYPVMKYRVTIREGVSPDTGEVLDTNESATFDYTDYKDEQKQKEFEKPKITVGGGTILVHYYLVNDAGEPINENGTVVAGKQFAASVKEAEYFKEDGSIGLVYNTPYTVPKADIAGYEYYGSYNLNDGDLTEGDSANVTLTMANSNQHVWFAYRLAPQNGSLTIEKDGCNETLDENQSFVFTVSGNGVNMDVVIHGNNSVTIKDLPAGTYTVTEDTAWSWRYTPDGNDKTVEVPGGGEGKVTFINSRDKVKWLDGNAYCDNKWIDGSKDKSN